VGEAIPETEVPERLTELLAELASTGKPVVIERDGHAVAALVPVGDVEELDRLRARLRRLEALRNLERIAEEIAAHPPCATEEEAVELAREWGEEIHRNLNERLRAERRDDRRSA